MHTTVIFKNWLKEQTIGIEFNTIDLSQKLKVQKERLCSAIWWQVKRGVIERSGKIKVHPQGSGRVVYKYVKDITTDIAIPAQTLLPTKLPIPACVNDLCGVLDDDLRDFKELVADFFHSQEAKIASLTTENTELKNKITDLRHLDELLATLTKRGHNT